MSVTSLPPPTTNADLLQRLSKNTEGIVATAKTSQLLPQLLSQITIANTAIRDSINQRNAELQRLQQRETILDSDRQIAEERNQTLQSQVTELSTLLEDANTTRSELQTRVADLTAEIQNLRSETAAQSTRLQSAQQQQLRNEEEFMRRLGAALQTQEKELQNLTAILAQTYQQSIQDTTEVLTDASVLLENQNDQNIRDRLFVAISSNWDAVWRSIISAGNADEFFRILPINVGRVTEARKNKTAQQIENADQMLNRIGDVRTSQTESEQFMKTIQTILQQNRSELNQLDNVAAGVVASTRTLADLFESFNTIDEITQQWQGIGKPGRVGTLSQEMIQKPTTMPQALSRLQTILSTLQPQYRSSAVLSLWALRKIYKQTSQGQQNEWPSGSINVNGTRMQITGPSDLIKAYRLLGANQNCGNLFSWFGYQYDNSQSEKNCTSIWQRLTPPDNFLEQWVRNPRANDIPMTQTQNGTIVNTDQDQMNVASQTPPSPMPQVTSLEGNLL